jgi:hypothetical protein
MLPHIWVQIFLKLNHSASYSLILCTGVSITALWPATVIKSHVTTVLGVESKLMREPDIFADACLAIAGESTDRYSGMPGFLSYIQLSRLNIDFSIASNYCNHVNFRTTGISQGTVGLQHGQILW